MFLIFGIAVLGWWADTVQGHSRWVCPIPRSDDSGLKLGPCGNQGDISDTTNQATLAPGLFTVYFQETIVHHGAPWRIALSKPGQDDYESCILLDHIPHNDAGAFGAIHGITINIPDIKCDNCALQLIQFMTDKVNGQCTFNPSDTQNFANGQCGSNYFSCANVKLTGSKPFDPSLCVQPSPYLRNYLYKSNEATTWKGKYIASYGPAAVRTPVPGKCSAIQDSDSSQDEPESLPSDSTTLPSDNTAPIAAGVLISMIAFVALFLTLRRRHHAKAVQASLGVELSDKPSSRSMVAKSNPLRTVGSSPNKPTVASRKPLTASLLAAQDDDSLLEAHDSIPMATVFNDLPTKPTTHLSRFSPQFDTNEPAYNTRSSSREPEV